MDVIRKELISAAVIRLHALVDYNVQSDIDKRYELRKQEILADKSLISDERIEALMLLNKSYDCNKVLFNEGTRRVCENCHEECLATSYCEHCIRNFLKAKFSNWTSGNDNVDNLIRKCQLETIAPNCIIEWIPYNNLKNVNYLTKGGCSKIYTADWFDGSYDEWETEERQLKRLGAHKVILKELENVESANRSWFEEGKSHLIISNKWPDIVQSYGLTLDPNGKYILVMTLMDMDLRKYLRQYHNRLKWNERINITYLIINALSRIHYENIIHRDLHSGNILYLQINQKFYISDLGFCGPADKPPNSTYGNLPYIAPEVISGDETTLASDIYSIGMLMWEISAGQPPFADSDHNYDLAMKIINETRPKIVPGTPLEYEHLMQQCWNSDPKKRPNIETLYDKIFAIQRSYYQNGNNNQETDINISVNNLQTDIYSNINSNSLTGSNIFKDLRNPIEEDQEVFHSRLYDFSIPNETFSWTWNFGRTLSWIWTWVFGFIKRKLWG